MIHGERNTMKGNVHWAHEQTHRFNSRVSVDVERHLFWLQVMFKASHAKIKVTKRNTNVTHVEP